MIRINLATPAVTSNKFSDGKAKEPLTAGLEKKPWELGRVPPGFYAKAENRIAAVKWLVEKLGNKPKKLSFRDFLNNGLRTVLLYHDNSPHSALIEAGFDIKPWEMHITPHGFYKKEENRVAATKWLVEEKLKKDPREMTAKDFAQNDLGGLFSRFYKNSPYAAISEAGYDIRPWEMHITPHGFYKKEENRVAATKWLAEEKLKKDPNEVGAGDFYDNGLGRMIRYYEAECSYGAALIEAGYDVKDAAPYTKKENRVAAVRSLVNTLKKDATMMTADDFRNNGLSGLLRSYYKNSPYLALVEAEYDIKPWEMNVTPMGFYEKAENRIAAIKWLVEKLKKKPGEMKAEDFDANGLGGIRRYYHHFPFEALIEAGYEIKPWEMGMAPMGFYEKAENRIAAIKWLVEKLKKKSCEICTKDFNDNGLRGVLPHYSSIYAALADAGFDIKPWEMDKVPAHTYDTGKGRVAAIKWLVKQLGKEPEKLRASDFKNGFDALLSHYGGSPYAALIDAGYDIRPWQMGRTKNGFYENPANRVAAIRWMVERLGKEPREITISDFAAHRIAGLVGKHYGGSPFSALLETGFVNEADEAYMKSKARGALKVPKIRTSIEMMVKKELLGRGYKEGPDFVHQFDFAFKFLCDFAFPGQKVVVECDGDYWHVNPEVYDRDNLDSRQKMAINKDKAKDSYISKFDGGAWTIIRLWESEIKKNVAACVDKIEAALKLRAA